jgi:hypothetical protein
LATQRFTLLEGIEPMQNFEMGSQEATHATKYKDKSLVPLLLCCIPAIKQTTQFPCYFSLGISEILFLIKTKADAVNL